MTAPEEFSRKENTVSGDTAAAITHRKPTTVEHRMAAIGTPRRLTDISASGACRRAASTNSIRDAVYSPEFRQDRTAVSTTAFMTWSAPGMPISLNAATYGEAASSAEFQGRMTASRKIDPTKNTAMRMITEFVALAMARPGSGDSAAAIVATSAPTIEKITTTMAEKTAPMPSGKKPPWAVRLPKSNDLWGQAPSTKSVPRARKTMIAATLIPANQNSNSPNEETENRLVAVMSAMSSNDINHRGASIQYCSTFAPATASKPITMTQKYQYSQATENPAQPPSAVRA